jgi:hypothetical protein
MRQARLLTLTLLLVSCNGSDSSGPSRAPVITNLVVQPVASGVGGSVLFQAQVHDPDGDVFGGQCVIETANFGSAAVTIDTLLPGAQAIQADSIVSCTFGYRGRGVQVQGGAFYVIDAAGHRSNALAFTFQSAARRP